MQRVRCNVHDATCKMQCVNGSASQTGWMDQLDTPAKQTSWTDQMDRPAGWTSSFYLKPWPVRIFEDFSFSLYIVAASESDDGFVFIERVLKLKNLFSKSWWDSPETFSDPFRRAVWRLMVLILDLADGGVFLALHAVVARNRLVLLMLPKTFNQNAEIMKTQKVLSEEDRYWIYQLQFFTPL